MVILLARGFACGVFCNLTCGFGCMRIVCVIKRAREIELMRTWVPDFVFLEIHNSPWALLDSSEQLSVVLLRLVDL